MSSIDDALIKGWPSSGRPGDPGIRASPLAVDLVKAFDLVNSIPIDRPEDQGGFPTGGVLFGPDAMERGLKQNIKLPGDLRWSAGCKACLKPTSLLGLRSLFSIPGRPSSRPRCTGRLSRRVYYSGISLTPWPLQCPRVRSRSYPLDSL